MIGKQQIVIDAADFVRGMSTSDELADGGFSPTTDAVNLTKLPGVLYAQANSVNSDTDTRLAGNMIASSVDMNVTSPTERLLVDDTGLAYRYDGTKLDAAGIALTAAVNWAAGFTDLIVFAGEAYVSSKEKLTRWQNDNTIDAGTSWPFSFTNTTVPHPGLVYENQMYWGDKNLLLTQAALGDTTAPTTVLTLSADQVIVALGIDPGSGLMLISTTTALNISDTFPGINKIHWYDGNSAKSSKVTVVDEMVLSFHSVGATVYVGFGDSLGYLSGSGIQFLRKLANVTLNEAQLPYKHKMTNIGNTLYVLDGAKILAFGEILPGRKVPYYAWSNPVNSNKPTLICDVGSKKLGIGFATTKFYTFDTSSVATTGTMAFYTNRISFPRPVYLRGANLEYADSVTNNDNNRNLYYQTEDRVDFGDSTAKLQIQGGTNLKNESGAGVYIIDNVVGFADNKVRTVQLRYNTDTTNFGLRRIILYYDYAE